MNETQLLTFISQHWLLAALFVILLAMILSYDRVFGSHGKSGISPQQLVTLINRHDAVIVDLRQREAFRQKHIIDAINIPTAQLEKSIDKLNQYEGKPIILVQNNDTQINKQIKLLQSKLTSEVKFLIGGFRAWQDAGLPTHKGQKK
ncbi:MAG: rhodanese-like domain-containing protein [Pseudomonadota bacterium]